MSKKRRRRRKPPVTACDRHHILFQKRYFSKGYAKALCQVFVRSVPVVYHRELHSILNTIPVPNGDLCRQAWVEYERNKDEIDSYGICRAIAWLYVNIPDTEFRRAMQIQLDFFVEKLK